MRYCEGCYGCITPCGKEERLFDMKKEIEREGLGLKTTKELLGGYTVKEFAAHHRLPLITVYTHLRLGRCKWPRQTRKATRNKDLLGGYTVTEFAAHHRLLPSTIYKHLELGRCKWPREPKNRSESSKGYMKSIWHTMKSNCYTSTSSSYKYYGARGIKVCDRWFQSFEDFYRDMGPKPGPKYRMVRIDTSKDYTPKNCKWVPKGNKVKVKVDSADSADRFNDGKVDLTLVPTEANKAEARVWGFGADKYGRDNWKKLWGDDTVNVVMASLLRHSYAILEGEINDPESGEQHAAHIRCNAAMLIEYFSKK